MYRLLIFLKIFKLYAGKDLQVFISYTSIYVFQIIVHDYQMIRLLAKKASNHSWTGTRSFSKDLVSVEVSITCIFCQSFAIGPQLPIYVIVLILMILESQSLKRDFFFFFLFFQLKFHIQLAFWIPKKNEPKYFTVIFCDVVELY